MMNAMMRQTVECRHRHARRRSPGRRPARPAPARIRATPGSSATPPISPPACGSAMTTARPMKKVTGGALPALAWHEFMVAAHKGVPVAQLPGDLAADSRSRKRSCRRRRCRRLIFPTRP